MEDLIKDGKVNYNSILPLREKAYVDALMLSQQGVKILGVFAPSYDEGLIRSYGMVPLAIQGLDGAIFEYGTYDSCQLIKSTMIYLMTDKCPLIHSSKAFYFSSYCPYFYQAFRKETTRPIHYGRPGLEDFLEEEGEGYKKDPDLEDILKEIGDMEDYLASTSLSGSSLFAISFYSKFILDLEERLAFFKKILSYPLEKSGEERRKISLSCPFGLVKKLDYTLSGPYQLSLSQEPTYGPEGCKFSPQREFTY